MLDNPADEVQGRRIAAEPRDHFEVDPFSIVRLLHIVKVLAAANRLLRS